MTMTDERPPSAEFSAKYASDCGRCDFTITVGDDVQYIYPGGRKTLVHVTCPQQLTIATPPSEPKSEQPRSIRVNEALELFEAGPLTSREVQELVDGSELLAGNVSWTLSVLVDLGLIEWVDSYQRSEKGRVMQRRALTELGGRVLDVLNGGGAV